MLVLQGYNVSIDTSCSCDKPDHLDWDIKSDGSVSLLSHIQTGYNSAYNDLRNKGLIDGSLGAYDPPASNFFAGLIKEDSIEAVCATEESNLCVVFHTDWGNIPRLIRRSCLFVPRIPYRRGFVVGYEGNVAGSGRSIYDSAFIESGGIVPPEPSSQQARKKRHDTMM